MAGIVTFQFGEFSNFAAGHYWNFQDEAVGRAAESETSPGNEALHYEKPNGKQEPRVVIANVKGFRGGIPILESRKTGNTVEDLVWKSGPAEILHMGETMRPHNFAKRLGGLPDVEESSREESESGEGEEGADEMNKILESQLKVKRRKPRQRREVESRGGQLENAQGTAGEPDWVTLASCLEAEARWVTDFVKCPINWEECSLEIDLPIGCRSLFERRRARRGGATSEKENESSASAVKEDPCAEGVQPPSPRESWWTYFGGKNLLKEEEVLREALLDMTRKRLEEAHSVPCLHNFVDWRDGFAGVASEVINFCREECPRTPAVVLAAGPQLDNLSDFGAILGDFSGAAFLHNALTELAGHNSPVVLTDCGVWRLPAEQQQRKLKEGAVRGIYSSAALLSTAFETMTSPYVCNPSTLASLLPAVVPSSLPLFSASLSAPLPTVDSHFPRRPLDRQQLTNNTQGFWNMSASDFGSSRLGNPSQWVSVRGAKHGQKVLFERLLSLPRELGGLLYDDSWAAERTFVSENSLPLPVTFPRVVEGEESDARSMAAATIVHAVGERGALPPSAETKNGGESVQGRLLRRVAEISARGKLKDLCAAQGLEVDELREIVETFRAVCETECDEED